MKSRSASSLWNSAVRVMRGYLGTLDPVGFDLLETGFSLSVEVSSDLVLSVEVDEHDLHRPVVESAVVEVRLQTSPHIEEIRPHVRQRTRHATDRTGIYSCFPHPTHLGRITSVLITVDGEEIVYLIFCIPLSLVLILFRRLALYSAK